MNSHTHFLFPALIGLVFNKLGIISWKGVLLCGIIGVLIDIDHYIEHILHAKSNRFSLKATWNNSIKLHRFHQRSFVHHWQGGLILSAIFAAVAYFNWQLALVLAVGYYTHLILDIPYHFKKERPFRYKIGQIYLRETHLEFILDVILVVGIGILLMVRT